MLFQKDIEPRCAYCQRGAQLEDDKILCVKKGVVSPGRQLPARFKYDPLKRVPPAAGAPRLQQAEGRGFFL